MKKNEKKSEVKKFWSIASCGEELYYKGINEKIAFEEQAKIRYSLEPYIMNFLSFRETQNKKILEIGVGLGADHQLLAEKGMELFGIDLTERAVNFTLNRFKIFKLSSSINVGDAENLVFENEFFDYVYSWGVIHHTPNTQVAFNEIYRVLKKGGEARIMIYHKYSFVGYMLWIKYALFKLLPFTSLDSIYSHYLESPGTKAYTIKEARTMCSQFSLINIETMLTHADLLTSNAGQRHRGVSLSIAKKIYPRWLIKLFFPKNGLFMLLTLTK